MADPGQFDAQAYWSRRLTDDWSLRGTGHICYSPGYNTWLYRAKRRALTRALAPLPPGRALDVGSGVGWVVALLLARGWQVSGCDLTEVAVSRLSERFPRLRFTVVDAGRDPLPAHDRSLDLVTVIDVAYHLVEAGQVEHLAGELDRVLAAGGVALVTDGFGAHDDRPDPHVRFRGRPTWEAVLRGSGMRIRRVDPYFRLLSRLPTQARLLHRLPGRVQGAIEYAADAVLPLRPHLRLAVIERATTR